MAGISIEEVDAAFTANDAGTAGASVPSPDPYQVAPSPTPDPAFGSEVRAQVEKQVGDMPIIDPTPDGSVTLLRGLLVDSLWQSDAVVRGLRGLDEEIITAAPNGLARLSAAIACGVTRIGTTNFEELSQGARAELLGTLLTPERQQLYLRIMELTFGRDLELTFPCQQRDCEGEVTFTLDRREHFELEPMVDATKGTYSFETQDGDTVSLRLNTGHDEAELMKLGPSTPAGVFRTKLLELCLLRVNGNPPLDATAYIQGLTIGDRDRLVEVIDKAQPKYDLEFNVPCPTCGRDSTIVLSWDDIFRS